MTKHTPSPLQPQLPYDEIPYGYCQCGCGQLAPISPRSETKRGYVKGQPLRFIIGHQNYVRPKRTPADKLWKHVDRRGPDECWEWTSYNNGYDLLGQESQRVLTVG